MNNLLINLSKVGPEVTSTLWKTIVVFGISFTIVLILIPIVIKLATKYKITDKPNHRKVHQNPIPTLGGVAIFIGSIVSFLLFVGQEIDIHILVLLIALLLLFITSIVDDL